MFFIGGLPALLALFVRVRVKESKGWEKKKAESWARLGRGILAQWKLFLCLVALMTMMIFVSHGTQDMYPSFLKTERRFSPQTVAKVPVLSNVGALVGGIVFGLLSDRFGRRRSMVAALLLAVLAIPLWAYAPTTGGLVLGACLLQFMVQGAWGIIPAHITELSPDSVRGFLPGFAYQCGVLLAAGGGYIRARFAHSTQYRNAM